MKPEKAEFYIKAFWYRTKASWSNGANGNAYHISICVKITQVSDVAHGPLV
jgi:hypothetical protein